MDNQNIETKMHEFFIRAINIHCDLTSIKLEIDYCASTTREEFLEAFVYFVFNNSSWSNQMEQTEFVCNSDTYLLFEEIYDYLDSLDLDDIFDKGNFYPKIKEFK